GHSGALTRDGTFQDHRSAGGFRYADSLEPGRRRSVMIPPQRVRSESPYGMSPSPEPTNTTPRTLFEKIWRRHAIFAREAGQPLLYVDRHFLQAGSAPAFEMLRQRGLEPRVPQRSFATPDHYVPTDSRTLANIPDPEKRAMAEALRRDSASAGIEFFG